LSTERAMRIKNGSIYVDITLKQTKQHCFHGGHFLYGEQHYKEFSGALPSKFKNKVSQALKFARYTICVTVSETILCIWQNRSSNFTDTDCESLISSMLLRLRPLYVPQQVESSPDASYVYKQADWIMHPTTYLENNDIPGTNFLWEQITPTCIFIGLCDDKGIVVYFIVLELDWVYYSIEKGTNYIDCSIATTESD
jgi:hypothetical protein